jgi:uncharacterized OsmC-like protein
VAIDCPYTGKGDEFSPVSLLSISLASCMLLSMGAIAQRDGLDLTGTVVDIEFAGLEKRVPHVDSITLAFNIPADFSAADRNKLQRAAELCPVMGSLGDETEVITTFNYGVSRPYTGDDETQHSSDRIPLSAQAPLSGL